MAPARASACAFGCCPQQPQHIRTLHVDTAPCGATRADRRIGSNVTPVLVEDAAAKIAQLRLSSWWVHLGA
eukprot:9915057-Alexandrium_andersonii.AAC.1